MTTGRRRVAAAVMMALLVASSACQDDEPDDIAEETSPPTVGPVPTTVPVAPSTSTSTTTTTTPGPTTSSTIPPPPVPGDLGILDGALDEDGTLGLDAALALFAAGYAPLPDVAPAREALVDGTPVLRTLLADLDRLTDDQRRVVESVTGQPGLRLLDVPDDPRQQAALGTINLGLGLFAQLLGRELRSEVRVTLAALPYANADGSHNFSSPTSHATALPFAGDGVVFDECRIRINVDALVDEAKGFGDPVFLSEVAEETFHCLQYGLVGNGADIPLWVLDGAAAFAGEDFAQGSARSAPWWSRWITEPQRPLQERTYDAAGFFFLIKGRVEVYKFTDVFLSESTLPSIYRRLISSEVFDLWGSQYATEPSWGSSYAVTGFGAPLDLPTPSLALALTVDGPPVVAGGPTSTTLSATSFRFTPPGDVLVVTSDPGDRGRIRFGDGLEAKLTDATRSYCLAPDGCICPGTTPDQQLATNVGGAELFIGLGPSTGGGPELAARSLVEWCADVLVTLPVPGSVDPCLVDRWVTTGYAAATLPGVQQDTTGGAGAVLDVRPDGSVTVDMTATNPVVVTTQGGDGAVTTTTLEYSGSAIGTWSAAEGVLDITGVDPNAFQVRVRVDASDGGQLSDQTFSADDTRLSEYASLVGQGRYECTEDSMSLTHVTPGVGAAAGFDFAGT